MSSLAISVSCYFKVHPHLITMNQFSFLVKFNSIVFMLIYIFCEGIIIVKLSLLCLEPNPISDLSAFVDAAIQDRFLIEWRKPYPNIGLR